MNPKDKIHSSWLPFVTNVLHLDRKLIELNKEILPNETFYPKREDIFNVFQMPLEDIKVVILGQDPYPQEGQAIGYAFAVSEETNKPASLRIIEKELGHEIDKTLTNWREQGVFLLNTALTVKAGQAGSHLKYWSEFTKLVIQYIINKNRNVVFLLWGRKAQEVFSNAYYTILKPVDRVYAPHPAAEAYNPGAGFIGSKCFEQVNQILDSQGKQQIKF